MSKVLAALALVTLVSCADIRGPQSSQEAFLYAEALYRENLAVAAAYSDACVQTPTTDCVELVIKMDDINREATGYLLAGQILMDGFMPPDLACDTAADPGCLERAREEQYILLGAKLQSLVAQLITIRGD
jgi:hypothetical protein